jgi:intein/homing endonuclease
LVVEPESTRDYLLIMPNREACAREELRTEKHDSAVNDVRLDKVVSVRILPPSKYVYDLTVPSTTNFGLLNGVVCADT